MAQAIRSQVVVVKPSAARVTKSSKIGVTAASSSSFLSSPARLSQTKSVTPAGRTALQVTARDAAWAPGSDAPAHLDGSLPGDFGFDPLGLGKNPEKLAWFSQAELVHARFAMLGTVGILVPDSMTKAGLDWSGAGIPWYEAGEANYWTASGSIFVTQLLLMGWAEGRRWMDIKNPGSVNEDPAGSGASLPDGMPVGYPGGLFDPFGFAKGDLAELQLKEIKNGRLAMISMLGFYVQHAVVGGTPLDNWLEHIGDPWNSTVLSKCSDFFVWDWAAPSGIISEFAPNA